LQPREKQFNYEKFGAGYYVVAWATAFFRIKAAIHYWTMNIIFLVLLMLKLVLYFVTFVIYRKALSTLF
ncbi:MAG: hypothetical protein KZQ57_11740, partial [gamma proteobacterium symbiont of Lucinoma myriamae]|nr:hypothetical protein [gamma proteobacterium symbiont of Lucinoma myriamae]